MKISHAISPQCAEVSVLTLDAAEEHDLTDDELISLMRHCAAFTYDDVQRRYSVQRDRIAPCCPEFGEVTRSGSEARVTVYAAA
jgi:hypothetical protein